MTYDASADPEIPSPREVQGQMSRLLDEFAEDTTGVTHALLVSRDGMKQAVVSHMDGDWADEVAAAFSGVMGLAKGVKGPTDKSMPAGQVLIERADTLFLATEAGVGSAFSDSGTAVSTILVVLAHPDANIGAIGFDAARLLQRFAPFMTTPVRAHDGQGAGVE